MRYLGLVAIGAAGGGLLSAPSVALEDASKPALCDESHVIARQTPPGGFDFERRSG